MARFPLHLQILVGMGLGLVCGLLLNLAGSEGLLDRHDVLFAGAVGEWVGKVFLALLNMVVVPLVASSIVSSFTGLGGQGGMGRIGARIGGYYMLTSVLAIATGILLVNLIRPGEGVDYATLMEAARGELASREIHPPDVDATAGVGVGQIVADIVLRTIPPNIVDAARSNTTILSVLFFSVVFGAAAVSTGGDALKRIDELASAVYAVMTTMTNGILHLAPLGISGYVFFVTATTGVSLAVVLFWYMVTVALGLLVHAGVTLPTLLRVVGGRSPLAYVREVREALLTAFSTASSAGTLPLTLRSVQRAGVPEHVATFALPLGATVNMDGTALYEVVAVLFISQMLGDLSLGQQVVVAFTALLASVGAAGIPHAGLVMMVVVMQAVGLPTDAVLVILAVDRVLDMGRTTVNVWSDMVGAALVARFEERSAAVGEVA
ncbi:MAG: dicarboxylate/amino acid:cation symporter [Myxococcales bacterium]|nr:dicarboxylate/amino acid:cation symporter [Myxococcales bacterium]